MKLKLFIYSKFKNGNILENLINLSIKSHKAYHKIMTDQHWQELRI